MYCSPCAAVFEIAMAPRATVHCNGGPTEWSRGFEYSRQGPSSVEQCRQALLDGVGDIERQSLDGSGRVHTARGNPDAAIDDEKVSDVVAAPPLIHHRSLRIQPHACSTQQVAWAVQHGTGGRYVFRPS